MISCANACEAGDRDAKTNSDQLARIYKVPKIILLNFPSLPRTLCYYFPEFLLKEIISRLRQESACCNFNFCRLCKSFYAN